MSNWPRRNKITQHPNRPQMATAFADASYREGFAGIACWARSDGRERLALHEPLLWKVPSSQEAETVALAKAIQLATGLIREGEEGIVVAQSDCTPAIGFFLREGGILASTSDIFVAQRRKRGSVQEEGHVEFVMKEINKRGIKLYLKHVKAHNGGGDVRSALNIWCCPHAKKARALAELHPSLQSSAVEVIP